MNTKLDARIRALVVEVLETSPAPPRFEDLRERPVVDASQTRPSRAPSRRRIALTAVASIVVLALGVGALLWLGDDNQSSRIATPAGQQTNRSGDHGVSVAYPHGWIPSTEMLTSLVDPAETFAVGTYPLRSGMNSCSDGALQDLGPTDAFITAYVWAAPPPANLPARPARFGPRLSWRTHDLCSRLVTNGTLRALDFRDNGRWIYVMVAFGRHISSARAAQAYRILDSLVVHPQDDTTRSPTTLALAAACATPSHFGTESSAHEVHGLTAKGDLWGLALGPGHVPPRAGEELKIVWRMTGKGPLRVVFTGPDRKRHNLVFGPQAHTGATTYQRPGDEWGTQFRFTVAGCWHIHLERTNTSGDVWLDVLP